jgi:hypothetical protein
MTVPDTDRSLTRDLTVPTVLSLVAAVLLLVASAAGLLYGRRGLYTPDPATLPAFLGQDAMTLAVGLPLLLVSVGLARRGSVRGLLLWVGALFYVAYSYLYYPLNPEFNALYLAYVAIVSTSGYGLLALLLSVDAEAVRARFSARTPTRLLGGFMAAMGALFAAKWVTTVVGDLAAGATPSHVELTVWPLDLIVALPALFWGGVWLWRRAAWGYVVGGLLLLKMALLGFTLVLNSWLVTLWGEPLDPMVPLYAVVGLGGLAGLVVYLRCLAPEAIDARSRAAPLQPGGAPLDDTRAARVARSACSPDSAGRVRSGNPPMARRGP